ncbi:hypothetical protein R1sor_019894 [Riccia sorocarpa]|uniref:Uncharacterized protein n=1 Tax=Riccia sorocarpa TaxID=122646 RepID=A0ABD3IGJ5_9MARC
MAGNDEEELLAELGVTAARPDEYERFVIAQAQELAGENGENGEENVDAALGFLQEEEEDVKSRERKGRIEKVLLNLEKEIAAVEAGRAAFTGASDSADEKANGKGSAKGKKAPQKKDAKKKNGVVQDNGAVHLALLDERLASLKVKEKSLGLQLMRLEKSKSDRAADKKKVQPGKQDGSSSTSSRKGIKVTLCDDDEFDAILDAENARRAKSKGTAKTPSKTPLKTKVVNFAEDDDFDAALDAATGFAETEREKLIRTGVITPFSKVEGFERQVKARPRQRDSAFEDNELVKRSIANATASMVAYNKSRPSTKLLDSSELPEPELPTREFRLVRPPHKRVVAEENEGPKKSKSKSSSGSKRKRPQPASKYRRRKDSSSSDEDGSGSDEPKSSKKPKLKRLRRGTKIEAGEQEKEEALKVDKYESEEEYDAELDGGLKIPGRIYNNLFDYQKTGVKWMWELHCQNSGGIIGDEMGLGKTVQVTAFLASLHYSSLYRPSIIVCPVTLLRQWKREVKKWYPDFKVEVLHDSAVKVQVDVSKKKKKRKRKDESEEETDEEDDSENEAEESDEVNSGDEEKPKTKKSVKREDRWNEMIGRVTGSDSGILITTYEQLRINREKLLDINWGYAVLDEGHRIRNPDADITLVCKQLQTVHRLIMTGAPIQNRLTELWSLFDFVFPGKLGVLPVFQAQFSLPIQIGGYANATPLQVSTAYKCAAMLRDLILPYLLRRMKADVKANLPKKTEHVLFCKLTQEQRSAYRAFLGSSEVEQIIDGNRNSLFGIDILRKICNHPDLLEREQSSGHPDYGNPERSGKLKLVSSVLELWKKQGHRVLLFAQTQQMLDIIQIFAESKGYEYRRMDGSTPVKQRMQLIDEFNDSEFVFVFIMTTKVGGLGTNLTGANRVIIFDPDWNPSTDMQARERAWRIGQKKDVTIYRLITQGTIEEKVYHRQIYKHFLTNKILKDPQQRRIFKSRDLRDLFTLQDDRTGTTTTETASLFGDSVQNIMAPEAGAITEEALNALCAPVSSDNEDGEQDPPGEEGKDKQDAEQGESREDESRILRDLFEANGIHSAMDHDAILGVSETEKASVDIEAERVARRAANALLQSRRIRSNDDISVPTWTGKSGEAGAPSTVRRKFGSTANSRLTNRPLVASVMVQSSTTQVARNASGSSTSSSSAVFAGVAASGVGRALSSSDVLNRMRERQMAAGMETGVSVPRFGRGTTFGRGSTLSQQHSQLQNGRGSGFATSSGQTSQTSVGR